MDKPRSNSTSAVWGTMAVLEAVDFLVYGTFGLGVLFASILKVATVVLKSGSLPLMAASIACLVALGAACIRDIVRRRWSLVSKGLVIAWIICALYGMIFLD